MADFPEMIGKYQISQLIAHGGMGTVYKAVHPTLKRNVILKKLDIRGNALITERFKREARIMMDFKHDNIVTVHDHFKEGSSYYIAQEFVDGSSLEELIRQERALPCGLAMHIFLEVCHALKYAHDNGVIHRDIKPANILISKKGDVKLVDFGIAGYAAEGKEGNDNLTAAGVTLGTVSYMPPEQFHNSANVDKGADIYAMGIVLYEMVTGKKPYPGAFTPETLLLIKRGRYLRVRRLNPRVDRLVARLCGRMIRPRKERRYRDLEPVIRLLERRLRREDRAELDKRLVALMNGATYIAPRRRLRQLVRRGLVIGAPLAILLGAALGWLQLSGRWYEWFFPGSYGALRVELNLSAAVDPTTFEAEALLEPVGGDARRPIRLSFPDSAGRAARWLGLEASGPLDSGRLFLPPGNYQLRLAAGHKTWSENFYLPPWQAQQADGRPQGLVLGFSVGAPPAIALKLSFRILDARMRQDISAQAAIDIKNQRGAWIPREEYPVSRLTSGRGYVFRVRAPGYHPQEINLDVDPRQSEARVQAALVPLEGQLWLTSALDGLSVRINGRKTVLTGGPSPRLVSPRLDKGQSLVLPLPPGPLRIEASAGGRAGSSDLTIVSGSTLEVDLVPDQDDTTLAIRIKEKP